MSYAETAARKAEAIRKTGEAVTLAFESSCDDTSAAIVQNGRKVLSCVMASQIDTHKKFGGVVPEIASRQHLEAVSALAREALLEAGCKMGDVDMIAATMGPGLVGALLVGLSFGKALAFAQNLPFVGVHHILGHISANYLADPGWEPPFLCLVVSGGHTLLARAESYTDVRILGTTRDDAAGEAFDKGARILGLPYPGGQYVDSLAKSGDPQAFVFPKAKLDPGALDFSFSGIKTNLMQRALKEGDDWVLDHRADLAASYQDAIVGMLTDGVLKALELCPSGRFALAGGVAANSRLRDSLRQSLEPRGIRLSFPPNSLCTDNAAMIASAGFFRLMSGETDLLDTNAAPSLPLTRA